MIIKLSCEELPMKYSEQELSEIVREYMLANESFSFKNICNHIFNKAKMENRIQTEEDTSYRGGIRISYFDETTISQLLWEEILNKRLFINFSKNPYYVSSNEIKFMVKKP